MMADYPFPLDANGQDEVYPGTAVHRLKVILSNVRQIPQTVLDGQWDACRAALLTAGGLKVDRSTGHAFNDDNHCDLTPMVGNVQRESNETGVIAGISNKNQLGGHIQAASITNGEFALPDGDAGGSWSTCTNGCNLNPPSDVAHVQFQSRVAFKLVWCPPNFEKFVLVDDEGNWLKTGTPSSSGLPGISWRKSNFALTEGGRYERVARLVGSGQQGQ